MNANSQKVALGRDINKIFNAEPTLADAAKSIYLDQQPPLVHNSKNYWTSVRAWVIMVD